jgi:hypothetical protein
MQSNNNIGDSVRHLVGNAKTDQAIEAFMQWATNYDKDIYDNLIALKAQLSMLKRNENLGLISFSEAGMNRARINNGILNLLEDADKSNEKGLSYNSSNSNKSELNILPPSNSNRLKVFYSYSHNDKEYLQSLQSQLKILERLGKIELWSDAQILPGERWNDSIIQKLQSSDIILLLISADFLNSDYIWNTEFKMALDREHKGEASIVPIILKKCLWRETPLKELQAIPQDDNGRLKPVAEWEDRDKAFAHIAEDLVKLISSRIERIKN